jgi:hypothetical protein
VCPVSSGLFGLGYDWTESEATTKSAASCFVFGALLALMQVGNPPAKSGVAFEPRMARITTFLDIDWHSFKGDTAGARWRLLNVPHDWSIEGPFGAKFERKRQHVGIRSTLG